MGKTKDLFMQLREEEDNKFIKEHIIFATLKPTGTVTTASNIKE